MQKKTILLICCRPVVHFGKDAQHIFPLHGLGQDGDAALVVAEDEQLVAGVKAENVARFLGDDKLALFADLDHPGVLALRYFHKINLLKYD